MFALVGFLVVRTQGYVSGTEFAPSHFQMRDFSFYEIPILHWQITPIRRSSATPKTATFIRQNTLIQTTTGVPDTWHLVAIARGLTGSTPADAALLVDQMTLESGSSDYWRTWSLDYPGHAQVLWPRVQRLAIAELYILMPRLFELAQEDQTPSELDQAIDDYLRSELRRLIVDLDAAGRARLASELLDEARAEFPNDPEFSQLRLSPAES